MAVKRLHISTIKRNAVNHGTLSADQWNDTFSEITNDLAALSSQWNLSVVPLLSTLPIGTPDSLVDAYKYGLDGRNLYLDSTADGTSNGNLRYFNSNRLRPFTVKEQVDAIYTVIDQLQESIPDTLLDANHVVTSVDISDGNGPQTGDIVIPEPVLSLSEIDSTALTGVVKLEGTNGITITQSGQTITISSTSDSSLIASYQVTTGDGVESNPPTSVSTNIALAEGSSVLLEVTAVCNSPTTYAFIKKIGNYYRLDTASLVQLGGVITIVDAGNDEDTGLILESDGNNMVITVNGANNEAEEETWTFTVNAQIVTVAS